MNEPLIYEIKKTLKSYRLKSGLNYKEFAKLSGLSEQTIRKYETADTTNIPIDKLFLLLKLLKVPLEVLISIIKLNY